MAGDSLRARGYRLSATGQAPAEAAVAVFLEGVSGQTGRGIQVWAKYAVSQVVGYIKGKSAIRMARDFMGRHQSFKGYHFWARGYFVSTVGIDETMIREYIRHQEENDRKSDQNRLF